MSDTELLEELLKHFSIEGNQLYWIYQEGVRLNEVMDEEIADSLFKRHQRLENNSTQKREKTAS